MNIHAFRGLVLVTLAISIISAILCIYMPTEATVAYYVFYGDNYIIEEPSLFIYITYLIGITLMIISVVGLLKTWQPSRFIFICSYIFMLPGYFIEPPLIYSPISQILYDLGMIGSGAIVAISFLEPMNSLFIKKSNNKINADQKPLV